MKISSKHYLSALLAATSALAVYAEDSKEGQPAAKPAGEITLTAKAMADNKIELAEVKPRALRLTFTAPGRVSFNTEAMAHVGSLVSGRVTEVKVRLGDMVKKGDVLITVESPELGRAQSEYMQKKTEFDVASAGVQPARDAYERAKKLFDESQGISLSDVQRREVEYRTAVGAEASAKAALLAAENALHLLSVSQEQLKRLSDTGEINPHFEIHAPIDGQVIEREVTLGELVSPDKEKLLVVADTSELWVLADVPEAKLSQLNIGDVARIASPILAGDPLEGAVSFIDPSIDAATRSARVRIRIKNDPARKIRPGMFMNVEIVGQPLSNAEGHPTSAVPDEAVQVIDGKPTVFVKLPDKPNAFTAREVQVGEEIGGFVPVKSGVKDGEQVVVAGSFVLKAELSKGAAEEDE